MYGFVCLFSAMELTKALKKSNLAVKILNVLILIYTALACLLHTTYIFSYYVISTWMYPYILVNSYEIIFWLICFVYLSVVISLEPAHEKEKKQKMLKIANLVNIVFTLFIYITG